MKAGLRISIKDYRRDKNLKIQLARVPMDGSRQGYFAYCYVGIGFFKKLKAKMLKN